MQILVIAATSFELQPFLEVISNYDQCDTLVTGVGMVATAFELGRVLHEKKYDLLINIGIGGCLDRTIEIGSVVQVVTESFVELGAEDGHNFIPIDQLGYGKSSFTSCLWKDKDLRLPFLKQGKELPLTKSMAVQKVSKKFKTCIPIVLSKVWRELLFSMLPIK